MNYLEFRIHVDNWNVIDSSIHGNRKFWRDTCYLWMLVLCPLIWMYYNLQEGSPKAEYLHWENRKHLLATSICTSIGVGSMWRFPVYCYKYGGGKDSVIYPNITFSPILKLKYFKVLNINKNPYEINHVERKVPKYENHKLRERKVKTLTRIWRDHKRDRHTQTHGNWIEIFRLAQQSSSIEREQIKPKSLWMIRMDQHSWKGSWWDLVWMGTARPEFMTIQVDLCPFIGFENIWPISPM